MLVNLFSRTSNLTLLFFFIAIAVPHQGAGQQLFAHEYKSMPGLSTNIFYSVEQDTHGAMWFVTQLGVVQYDGVEWYLFPDSLGLPSDENTSLTAISKGGIAAAGINKQEEDVISVFRNDKWKNTIIPKSSSAINKYLVWEFEGGIKAAFSTSDSLLFYTEKMNAWTSKPLRTDKYHISDIRNLRTNGDKLYIVCTEGIYYSNDLEEIEKLELETDVLPSSDYYDLGWNAANDSTFVIGRNFLALATKDTTLLLEKNNELNRVHRGTFSAIGFSFPFVFYTSSSHLFLYDLTNGQSTIINAHEKGTLTKWHDIEIDRQGILWMVNTRGVSKLPSLAFSNYSNNYFLDDEVSNVLHLSNGNTFLGHNIGFTLVDENTNVLWSHTFKSLEGFTRILDAQEDNKGNIYAVSVAQGLIKINPRTRKIKYIENIPANCIKIRNDTIWVGTISSLVTLVNDNVVSKVEGINIRRLDFDLDGNLVLLTRHGIIKPEKEFFDPPKLSGEKYDTYFAGGYKGRFLVATIGGLYFYDDGDYEPFIVDSKPFKQPVYSFAIDAHENLWIGSSNGVYQVCQSEMIGHYDVTNGLISNEVNRAALVFDKDGHLWIGTHQGLTLYNKHLDNPLRLPPEVRINHINNAGNPYPSTLENEFDYANRDLEFVFSAYSFYSESSINFEYQLKGFDKQWKTIGNYGIRAVRYDNLPPGDYSFIVRARESQRDWGKVAESAMVSINSPFYFTIWFVLLCIVLIVFIVAFVTTFINQKNLAKKLEHKLQEKMKEVLDSKEELSQQNEELKTLNIQLDSFAYSVSHDLRGPIASSLGLINLFKQDKDNRERYFELIENSMIRMDKFVADVLEVSRNSRTDISVDNFNVIEQIGEIIENQKYRDGARDIEFQIKTKNEMIVTDKRRLNVILTNLISNAITYCDNYKEEKKVEISFFKENGDQVIVVKDNGIGIKKELLDSIFKIFFRASERSTGSGLGLYIAQQTAKRIKGSIKVESEFGEWTKFSLHIPEA